MILWVPVLLISFLVFLFEKILFHKYRNVQNRRALTGVEVARHLLDACGLSQVAVEAMGRRDCWRQTKIKQFLLDEFAYESQSLIAIAFTAREAVRRSQSSRSVISLDLGRYGERVLQCTILGAWIVLAAGFLNEYLWSLVSISMTALSVVFFVGLFTLPNESEISKRAYDLLRRTGYFEIDEQVRLGSLLNLLRFHGLASLWRVPLDFFCYFLMVKRKKRGL